MDGSYRSSLQERIARATTKPFPKTKRSFDLPTAPTFYPAEDEFADPSSYIASIRPQAEKFGLCKVVPPKSFSPRFNLDVEEFKFQPRKQKLNGLGAATRAELNFISNLLAYLQQTQTEFKPPTLQSQRLNLYRLHQQVGAHGGAAAMTREKWLGVGAELGFKTSQPSFAASIRGIYDKYLKPFNEYTTTSFKSKQKRTKRKYHAGIEKPYDSDDCGVCLTSESYETLVLCEICEIGFHPHCLNPKLEAIPECEWFCSSCLKAREVNSSPEPGELCSLLEFSAKADEFKKKYFSELLRQEANPDTTSAGEVANLIEEEYWRLVGDPLNEVQVEDGANLAVPSYGSGFPNSERHPDAEFSRHAWNLNNFPALPSSVFSYLKGSIQGFTVPELFINQCFSTTCWHTKEHYAYSVNFHHWGDTKTWYGVAASHSSAFEVAFRREAYKVFEKQPDILFRRCTTLSPQALTKHKVPVYAIDQHPGEFVITFPRAYHAGVSHGLNFIESINFGPADWLPFGQKYVSHLQAFKRPPVFCHEDLVLRTASATHDRSLACALRESLEGMQDTMKDLHLRSSRITLNRVCQPHANTIPKCSVCKAFCFYISLGCKCQQKSSRVTCLMHCPELCDCILGTRICYQHLPPAELENGIAHLIEVASPGAQWVERYADFVSGRNYPELGQLEALLAEAHSHYVHLPEEAAQLSKFLETCRNWKSQAGLVITANLTHAPEDLNQLPPPPELLRHIQALNAQSQRLGFQCEEKASLDVLGHWISMFCSAARILLANPNATLSQALLFQGQYSQLGLILDEGERIDQLVKRLEWCEEAKQILEGEPGMVCRVQELRSTVPHPICPRTQELLDKFAAYLLRQAAPEPQMKTTLRITFQAPQEPMDTVEPSPETQSLIDIAQNLLILSESEDPLARPSTTKPAGVLKQAKDVIHMYSVFNRLQTKLNEVEPWILDCLGTLANQNVNFRRTLQARLTIIQKQSFEHSHGQGCHSCTCFSEDSKGTSTITCNACGVTYHMDCLRISAAFVGFYVCPICDVTTYRPIRSSRIHVNDLSDLIAKGKLLPFIPSELTLMVDISKSLGKISSQALALAQAPSTTMTSLKDQLRLLEGLIIYLEHETKVLRSRIARLPLPTIPDAATAPSDSHQTFQSPMPASRTLPSAEPPSSGPPPASSYDPFSIASLVGTSPKPASLTKTHAATTTAQTTRPQTIPILPAQPGGSRNVAIFPRPAPRLSPYPNSSHQYPHISQRPRTAPSRTQMMLSQQHQAHLGANMTDPYYGDAPDKPLAVMHHPGRTTHPVSLDGYQRPRPYSQMSHPPVYTPLNPNPGSMHGYSRQSATSTQAPTSPLPPSSTPTIVAHHLQSSSQPAVRPNHRH
ncbi:hypothetical protein DSO57_1017869 [Entomophthora muscae]|uniref:Uncharacterized protein n=1 Tax=Entomophthora muscae TaxID=34485 RepID=A0ACC2TF82_9FUNG|nr:hypothetical protein DSO57_1017869 [Entomophthora muscae]